MKGLTSFMYSLLRELSGAGRYAEDQNPINGVRICYRVSAVFYNLMLFNLANPEWVFMLLFTLIQILHQSLQGGRRKILEHLFVSDWFAPTLTIMVTPVGVKVVMPYD